MSAGRICVREVFTADGEETAVDAAKRMLEHNVGTLVVVDESRRVLGVLTDRDLTVKVIAQELDPQKARVADVMAQSPRTIAEDTPIEDALTYMHDVAVRRLPVVDEERRLVGLLSLDDILNLISQECYDIGRVLKKQAPLAFPI